MKRKTYLLFISIILLAFVIKAEHRHRHRQKPRHRHRHKSLLLNLIPFHHLNLWHQWKVQKLTCFPVKPSLSGSMLKVQANMKLRLNTRRKWHLVKNATTNLVSYTLLDFPGAQPEGGE